MLLAIKERWLVAGLGLVAILYSAAAAMPVPSRPANRGVLRKRIAALGSMPKPSVGAAPIAAKHVIYDIYERRDYRPAWRNSELVRQLYTQVLHAADHGLNPNDFHARQLARLVKARAESIDPERAADVEILCTDAMVRLFVTLRFGKLDPSSLDPAWNFSREIEAKDPVDVFNHILVTGEVSKSLAAAAPQNDFYRSLQAALGRYRHIREKGGWPVLPPGPVLKTGSHGPRVELLREWLRITGDLAAPDPADPRLFDRGLEGAVQHFQMRHGIDTDGKAGPRTIHEINVPIQKRIDQIRVNLERMRWVFRDIPRDYLVVDIAGFHAYLLKDGKSIWSSRVQVGKPFHETPVFRDTMRYIELNPTWTVPPGILRKEILPAIRRDPAYLSHNNMVVLTRSGATVDPSTIDWAGTAGEGFPYMIRQQPGPNNALGRVKFMFPNKYMVYLHDTPSKGLFARPERAFSHGCIRVQRPIELALLLLEGEGWDRGRIESVIASKKTTRVPLHRPLPVMLLYWTAEASDDGTVYFRKDLYDRDAPIIKGLDEPFRVDPPKGCRC